MAILLRRNRNFRLLFSASAVSNLGDGVSALAFPWLAALLTRDPLLIGLVAMAGRCRGSSSRCPLACGPTAPTAAC